VFLSVGGAVELTQERPSLTNQRQWVFWTVEGLKEPHATALRQLYKLVSN
jgi:hypothetical protein